MLEQHSIHSVLRERIVEHLLIGKLLQRLWIVGNTNVEILRSEFDRGGYDLVAECGPVTRHIQLKCSRSEGRASFQTISLNLTEKTSGCVVWIVIDENLNFDHFLWLGGAPSKPLLLAHDLKLGRQTKGDSQGTKLGKANFRKVPKRLFARINTIDELLAKLFGPQWRPAASEVRDLSLEELLDGITPESLHPAVDCGPPVGKEIW